MNYDPLFTTIEKLKYPSTILWRSIEVKILKDVFDKSFKNGMNVLDLGCGEGLIGSILFPPQTAIGVDNDKEMVKRARNAKIYKRVVLADGSVFIDLPDNSIDIVVANSVFEHIQKLDGLLIQIGRIIKPGGVLIFTVPNNKLTKYSALSLTKIPLLGQFYGYWRNRKFNHYHLYNIEKWQEILEKNNFKIIKYSHYLNKKQTEIWDYLLILFFILEKINLKLFNFIYNKKLRNKIFNIYLNSHFEKSGSATCFICKII